MSAVLLTEWARLLIDSLVQSGIGRAVISPGSRSTPYAFAALEHPGLVCHSVIDERCAGFFALGQTKLTGIPSLLICTSGTAPAHYFPAVVEAAYAHLPLVVLSADRPVALQYRAAPQTIDQTALFGKYARGSFDLGLPNDRVDALSALQATAALAVRLSQAPLPGAVQLNAPATKPLEPAHATSEADRALEARVGHLIERGPTRFARVEAGQSEAGIAALASDLCRAERGLIVCGALPASNPGATASVLAFAERTGFPVLAEAQSQLLLGSPGPGVCTGLDTFLRSTAMRAQRPDLVIELGAPLTSRAWAEFRGRLGTARRHVVSAHGWPDEAATASWMHASPVPEFLTSVSARVVAEPPMPAGVSSSRARFRQRYLQANQRTLEVIDSVLTELPFGEAHAVRAVCEQLPKRSVFLVGNSLPLRSVDLFARPRRAGVTTLAQRGTNGIDGLVSGAAGVASRAGCATTLLLGDVSLAHDIGGLSVARKSEHPLVIVVLDNAGGRIFDELPWGAAEDASEEHRNFWLTPPELDFSALAQGYGVRYRAAANAVELASGLEEAYRAPGATLVSVKVEPGSYHQVVTLVRQATLRALDGSAD